MGRNEVRSGQGLTKREWETLGHTWRKARRIESETGKTNHPAQGSRKGAFFLN